MFNQIQVGPQTVNDGSTPVARGGKSGDAIVSELHGRFYEQTFRGNVYSGGLSTTSIANATYTTGTLTASETPILGVWNPTASTVNLVILQASLVSIVTATTATGPGTYVWATSTGNGAISTGTAPFNRKTLARAGSQAKDMSNVALTGLTNNVVVIEGSSIGGYLAINTSVTPANGFNSDGVQNFDGGLIVPPGGVLTLIATTTPVAISVSGSILWEEVAI